MVAATATFLHYAVDRITCGQGGSCAAHLLHCKLPHCTRINANTPHVSQDCCKFIPSVFSWCVKASGKWRSQVCKPSEGMSAATSDSGVLLLRDSPLFEDRVLVRQPNHAGDVVHHDYVVRVLRGSKVCSLMHLCGCGI